ncbi:PTEN-induced putative kinase 1 [Lycorma delicatula]|uniref:PTEN-induced putative kinase 1 n=1 Tax=Lycorma delicatula TaxID=130591 RepID=UPI003F517BA5
MSLRLALSRLTQNGRVLFRFCRSHPIIVDVKNLKILPQGVQVRAGSTPRSIPSSGVQSHFQNFRKLIVDNVLKRVTNSLNTELRQRTTRQLLYGNSAPFFALVGVSLASGTGILTKEDELEGVCWEIREAISHMQVKTAAAEYDDFISEEVSVNDFEVGPAIAKGSNAVVYAARKKLYKDDTNNTMTVKTDEPVSSFPLAVKMMFNYDAESNATSILRAMYRETIPAKVRYSNEDIGEWEKNMGERAVHLPPHPNIVAMHCAFADRIPDIPGAKSLYPDALPTRINPDGFGRNMSLFLLMKRYDTSLKEYLKNNNPEVRKGILLLTQLLEAVAHINRHGVAHRDLKSDNILLDTSVEDSSVCPSLVVTDFGCCLADKWCGLSMPYRTMDTDKGGNAALMAPEVALATPGVFSYIDYSKSDAWAVGSIAYEILSEHGNPFYRSKKDSSFLRNTTYSEEELPTLGDDVPEIIARLIYSLLSRTTSKRPSAELAATICQLYLWAPSSWLKPYQSGPLPSSSEILQWLLCLTTKVLCEGRSYIGRRTATEYELISCFLSRIKLSIIRQALYWIQQR